MINPALFWEMNSVNHQQHPMTTIFKVIRYGSLEDLKELITLYPTSTIQDFLNKRGKELDLGEYKLLSLLSSSLAQKNAIHR